MKPRQSSLASQWLIIDRRLGDEPWSIVKRLPSGSGVLMLFHDLSAGKRQRLIRRLRYSAAAKSLVILDEAKGAARIHTLRELRRALLARTPVILLSPIYRTPSHPTWRPIPRMRAAAYARLAGRKLLALGGIDQRRFKRIERLGFIGWAGIDAWL